MRNTNETAAQSAALPTGTATFVFTGGEIVGEFLMSLGYLPGAHVAQCPIYSKVLTLHPPWSLTS